MAEGVLARTMTFFKGASPEDFMDLVLLFLVQRRWLWQFAEDERKHDDVLRVIGAIAMLSYPRSVVILSHFRV